MSLFTYEIAPPTNVVEASASPEPDDVSVAYVRIEATALNDVKEGDISAIRFEIDVLPKLKKPAEDATEVEKNQIEESNDQKRQAALTRNPGNITPVAAAFRHWTFSAPAAKGIFVARPDALKDEANDQTLVKAEEVLVFYLYDIEVIDRDGETKIKVTEVDGKEKDIPDTVPDLVIRKIFPTLRIDFFTADKLVVKAGTQVKLEWATTSATKILLSGITQADIALNDKLKVNKDPDLDGFQILETNLQGQQVAQKDGAFFVRPETTTAYTLQARSNNADTVALQQLTIMVTEQIKTNKIIAINEVSTPLLNAKTPDGKGVVSSNAVFASFIEAKTADDTGEINADKIIGGLISASRMTPTTLSAHGNIILHKREFDDGLFATAGHENLRIIRGYVTFPPGATKPSATLGSGYNATRSGHTITITFDKPFSEVPIIIANGVDLVTLSGLDITSVKLQTQGGGATFIVMGPAVSR